MGKSTITLFEGSKESLEGGYARVSFGLYRGELNCSSKAQKVALKVLRGGIDHNVDVRCFILSCILFAI